MIMKFVSLFVCDSKSTRATSDSPAGGIGIINAGLDCFIHMHADAFAQAGHHTLYHTYVGVGIANVFDRLFYMPSKAPIARYAKARQPRSKIRNRI
jgi:hypothetical protein